MKIRERDAFFCDIIPKSIGGCQRSFLIIAGERGADFNYNAPVRPHFIIPILLEARTETFDVLDCCGEKTGEVILRDDAHKTGAWHGAFHCLVIYEREGRGYALFQKRSAEKTIAPEKYDVSVGGHYAAGEDASSAGPREIREELGLDVSFLDLLPLGRRVFVYCFAPGVIEHEFQDVFLLVCNARPDSLVLQQEEVAGVLEMDIEQGVELFSGKLAEAVCSFSTNGIAGARVQVSQEDFVPCMDSYYLKLLLLARRYLKGERSLLLIRP